MPLRIGKDDLKQIRIPVPSLEEQERIASILDKFYELRCDMKNGIPGLISDNQKQYEYYRDVIISLTDDA